jgi:hypothetical protein
VTRWNRFQQAGRRRLPNFHALAGAQLEHGRDLFGQRAQATLRAKDQQWLERATRLNARRPDRILRMPGSAAEREPHQ